MRAAVIRQRLDFARPQPAVRLRGQLYGGLLLVASLALVAGLVARYQELAADIESAETRIERLARMHAPGRLARDSREAVAEEVRRVNQAAARLTIPWEDLFRTLEAAADKRVALLSLQPNVPKAELKISGEADDLGAILRYAERLAKGDALADVRLISHEVVSRPNATQVRFELTANWRVRT